MLDAIRLGKYALLERIAVGGMAEVFRAAMYGAEGFAKELIIKRILPDISEDETFVRMFIDEARLASKLQHPNIVQVFDFDCIDGVYFIAMEYVRGRDLAYVLKRAVESGSKLPEAAALYIFAQLLEALRYAHEKTDEEGKPLDIVHRDVSPQNILLSFEGEVKLADFGIAKAAGSSRTATGSLKGKYRYMAPEYIQNQRVDQKSDIYAAGAILYELTTNQRPFRDVHDMALITDIASGNFKPPREVDPTIPPAIASLIETAMALDPSQRFPSARAFLDALKETCRARNVELGPEALRSYLKAHLPREIESTRKIEVPTAAQRTVAVEPATKLLAPKTTSGPIAGWRPFVLLAVALIAAITTYFALRPPQELHVLLRMMTPQEDWIRNEVLAPFGEEQGFEIPISRYRSVQDVEDVLKSDPSISLVKVEQTMLRPLVEADLVVPIDVYLKDRGRTQELEELLSGFSQDALKLAMVPDHVELRLYGLPRKVEVSVLVYRRSKVEQAAKHWKEHREALEQALLDLVGHTLPAGYDLEANPSEWDDYDVLVAGWYWSRTPERGRTAPRLMNRSYHYIGTFHSLYDRLSALSSEQKPAIAPTEAMIDLFVWEALFRELGLYREKMFIEEEVVTGRVVQEAMAQGEIYLTRMHSLGIKLLWDAAKDEVKNDLGFALLPLGVSPQLDSEGAPVRVGSRRAAISSWSWAIPKNAPLPEDGFQLARHLTSKEIAQRETDAFWIQPVRRDVRAPSSPLALELFPVLEVQMKIAAGHRLPAQPTRASADHVIDDLVGSWWRVVAERNFIEHRRIDRRKIARELERSLRDR